MSTLILDVPQGTEVHPGRPVVHLSLKRAPDTALCGAPRTGNWTAPDGRGAPCVVCEAVHVLLPGRWRA